jgi:Zn-dependent M28 family amino/carboxypeptidase
MSNSIQGIIGQVSRANIERDDRHLSTAYPTRHTLGRYLPSCATWLQSRLRENGLRDVAVAPYMQDGRTLPNVVGRKAGASVETILVTAHFDSRMRNLDDADAPAPGADDNGTGVAVVLELARLVAPLRLARSVRFVLFSGEEQGLWGSTAYARQIKAERLPVAFVLNLDELGFPPPDRALFIDRAEGDARQPAIARSHALAQRMQELARTVVRVRTRFDKAENSDYNPFGDMGYTIVGLYEAGKSYPAYHTSSDTIEKVDFAYVHDMARLALATVLSEAGA